MFHYRNTLAASPLHQLLESSAEALAHAAELLAGRRGLRLVSDLTDDLGSNPDPTRRVLETADELLQVLSLDCADILGSEEAALFSAINPWDPVVEEICLLTDALASAIGDTRDTATDTVNRKAAA